MHLIEKYDRPLFEYITSILIEVNRQRHMPTKEQLFKINIALCAFEDCFRKERTNKGHLIIKERYLRRILNNK